MTISSPIKRLRIIDIIRETDDAKTFILEPLDEWEPVYEAGQFLTFLFGEGEEQQRRSYSVSSAPLCGEPLAITVKRVVNGRFSRQLLDHYKKGDILHTTGFSGFFCLPQITEQYDGYFFLAAGSGITPCFSLIKTLLLLTDKKIVLVFSNRNRRSAIFYNQLIQLQEKHSGQLHIRFLFSDSNYYKDARLSKPLLQQLLATHIPNESQKTGFYTCGPELYMEIILITLISEGIKREQIRRENFDSRPRLYTLVPPDQEARIAAIIFKEQVYKVVTAWPQTILAAAKAQHIQLPYSCEAGRCGSCVATCTKGTIWMGYNEVLTDEELAKGKILTCQAYPVGGDVEIKVE